MTASRATTRPPAQKTTRLLDLRDAYRQRLRGKANAIALIDALFGNPYVTAASAGRRLGVSDPTARSAIATPESEGGLEEITGWSWGQVYRCQAILDALSGLPLDTSI